MFLLRNALLVFTYLLPFRPRREKHAGGLLLVVFQTLLVTSKPEPCGFVRIKLLLVLIHIGMFSIGLHGWYPEHWNHPKELLLKRSTSPFSY